MSPYTVYRVFIEVRQRMLVKTVVYRIAVLNIIQYFLITSGALLWRRDLWDFHGVLEIFHGWRGSTEAAGPRAWSGSVCHATTKLYNEIPLTKEQLTTSVQTAVRRRRSL